MSHYRHSHLDRRDALRLMGLGLGATIVQPQVDIALAQDTPTAEALDDELMIPAWYYQHFDGDYAQTSPETGFGGWKKEPLAFSRRHTALVVMHAWAAGATPDEFPGWWRAVPYIPRSNAIMNNVFPPLLKAVRASDWPVFHVVGGGDYYRDLPGYQRAKKLAGNAPEGLPHVERDPIRAKLDAFKSDKVFPGKHNTPDIDRGFAQLTFGEAARPVGDEGVAENSAQLYALCREANVNHLVYCGFAINWCLLLSPGGMAEMQQYGCMCSTIRQATTAVENKESAPNEWAKEIALWRVALAFGFVFDAPDIIASLPAANA